MSEPKESFMTRALLALLCTAVFLSAASGAQTLDEIIAKNIQARGGVEKLKAIKTVRISGKVNQGDFRAAFVQENRRPGKVREEFIIQGMAQVEAFDGKTGWVVSPFQGRKDPDLLSADDMKNLV